MTDTISITAAMHDPQLFGRWFTDRSWQAWDAFLAACFGLPLNDEQAALVRKHTGRKQLPTEPVKEAWVIVGRRGGKSRIAALVAVYLACFRDYDAVLAPGEVGTLPVIAADKRQARTIMRYVKGYFDSVPMLSKMVANPLRESIELTNRVVIEVHTASFRAIRGYTMIGAICDEIAFWSVDDGSANPDVEIINGLRPGMATIPGALLLCISSPYARRGAIWQVYHKHHNDDGDPTILVLQAPTRVMNPTVPERTIAEAYEQDEIAAAAEYGAEFRRDIESFVGREAVDACVVPDQLELPPTFETTYHAFVDPSGGSQDSMTLCITHREPNDKVVVDAVRERRPPFSPTDVVDEFTELLKSYHLSSVTGDRYGGEWVRAPFLERGIGYRLSEQPKSDLYRDLLPMLNSQQVDLLDHKRLIAQLQSLERRTARSGRDSIDHAPGGHDDVVNAVAGAVVLAGKPRSQVRVVPVEGF